MNEQRWIDTELVELAQEHGYEVTARQLERWHKADVLPRPVQDPHVSKGTSSYYPPGTDAYVLTSCRLRGEGKGRPLWRLRFELWWEGFDVPLDAVHESLLLLLAPAHAQLHDEAAVEHSRESLAELEWEQTRRGLTAHTRQALRGRPYEAVDLLNVILDLLTGQPRAIDAPVDKIDDRPRTFADALADVLTFDGRRNTPTGALEDVIRGGGISEALAEVTSIASQSPEGLLAGIREDRLRAARDAVVALQTSLSITAKALRLMKGHDMAVLRLVRQAEREAGNQRARAELVMLFASTSALDPAMLREVGVMFEATERRYGAMLRVLEAIPESRLLEQVMAAFEALPPEQQDALTEHVQAFLASHPDVAAAWDNE